MDTGKGERGGGRRKGGGGASRRPPHSRAVEDYLKAVYNLQDADGPVSTSALADELGRSAASVTNMVKALADQGLLQHVPYRGVRLTQGGEHAALRIIRRHRVIETYLIERLGYTWDGVHAEAERLEHAASDELIDRMARALGEPTNDPHGAPIPTREGEIERRDLGRLSELPAAVPALVRQVADEDPERLRYLETLGLVPGARVVVRKSGRSDESIPVRVGGRDLVLDRSVAEQIRVEPEAARSGAR